MVKLSIKRRVGEGNLTKVKVTIYLENKETYTLNEPIELSELETKPLDLVLDDFEENLLLNEITKVVILPIIRDSKGKEFIGNLGDEHIFYIPVCIPDTTCSNWGFACGQFTDECEQLINCDSCTGDDVCSVPDGEGVCEPPTVPPFCGDGGKNQPSEECDIPSLDGKSCSDISPFEDGVLDCYPPGPNECTFDTSACYYCGDGTCQNYEDEFICPQDCLL